jgi:predicted esterase
VTTEITLPACKTSDNSRSTFDDSPPTTWTDSVDGDQRAACVYVPDSASPSAQVPLVIFLHGSHGTADDVYDHMSLRSKATSFDLGGNGGNTGFALISAQGRNLHWMGPNPAGSHHDYLFRDLASPSMNPDIRALDHLIDEQVAGGKIDANRIYLMGWSNGAFMAEAYGVARHVTATPGGNHVAAIVSYAGADPFNTPDAGNTACQLAPYPSSSLPMYLIHRSCDALVACDTAQQAKFNGPPGYAVEDWLTLAAVPSGLGDPNLSDQIVDYQGASVASCTAPAICTEVTGATNHIRWPDGIADKGGHDWEPQMLGFLRDHPLTH